MVIKKITATLLLCSLVVTGFTGCGGVALFDEMSLLQAPLLNLEQKAVYQALESTLNTAEIFYKYPRQGEYRTPFAFHDLDQDGVEEAIVFYAEQSEEGELFAKVLKQTPEGDWIPFRDLAGMGDQVTFLDFAPMVDAGNDCIIIGWENSKGPHESYLGVYSLANADPDAHLFLRDEGILEVYDAYNLYDYDQDGLFELLLARKNLRGDYELALIKEDNNMLLTTDSVPLNPNTFTILQMLQADLWNGSKGIFIDQRIQEQSSAGGTYYATEIIEVQGNTLVPIATHGGEDTSQEHRNYLATERLDDTLSADLLQNGNVLVPRVSTLPGLADTDDKRKIKLTEYRRLTGTGFVTLYNTIVNTEDGYLIFLPERWLGNIVVEQHPEKREWSIHKLTHETGETSLELFRVRLHTAGDFIDPSAEADIELAVKGPFHYYGYVSNIPGEELALTTEEAKEIFALLES